MDTAAAFPLGAISTPRSTHYPRRTRREWIVDSTVFGLALAVMVGKHLIVLPAAAVHLPAWLVPVDYVVGIASP